MFHRLRFDNLRGDLFGGLTAAVVALPLALAFGVASGAGPMAGLYGAVFVGFFAALFGGTPSQVSGPTGPMTVVMAAVIVQYAHDPAMAFTVVIMGGAFQILFGLLRLGSFISLVPFPVVSGFMSGIGCIILLLQVAPLFGLPPVGGGPLGALLALPATLAAVHPDALAVGLLSLAIVVLTPSAITRRLPSPLIALIVGTALVWLVLPGVPVLGDIPTGLPSLQLPTFGLDALPGMLGSALVLAMLGAIDSLLTSLIADNISGVDHEPNRELVGQGIGNMMAGFFGGIPGAGATMRTVVNLRAGGATPVSGMVHAVVLLAVVLGLGPLAGHVPHAVLAGILVKVGWDIIDWGYLRRVRRAPRAGVILMVIVLVLTVFVDLIVAVAAGVVAASLILVKRMSDMQLATVRTVVGGVGEVPLGDEEKALIERCGEALILLHIDGPITFGAAKGLTKRMVLGRSHRALILDLSDLTFVDTSGALAIEDVIERARGLDLDVSVAGLRQPVAEVLDRLDVLSGLAPEHHHRTRLDALRRAAALVPPPEQTDAIGAGDPVLT